MSLSGRLINGMRARVALARFGALRATRIPTYTQRSELNALYALASYCPRQGTVLEIGSYLGASTSYICAAIAPRDGRVVCIDTWQNTTMPEGERDTMAEFMRNVRPFRGRIELVRGRSDEVDPDRIPESVYLAFIDGDHSYGPVQNDFRLVSRVVVPGGVVAFHDHLYFKGVSRVVGEALASGEWTLRGLESNLCWLVRADADAAMCGDVERRGREGAGKASSRDE